MFSFFSAHRASQLPGRRKVKAFEVRIAKGELLYPGMRWNIVPSINVHTSHTLTASSKSSNFSFNLTMRLRGFISHLMARNIFFYLFFAFISHYFPIFFFDFVRKRKYRGTGLKPLQGNCSLYASFRTFRVIPNHTKWIEY